MRMGLNSEAMSKRSKRKRQRMTMVAKSSGAKWDLSFQEAKNKKAYVSNRIKSILSIWKKEGGQPEEMPDVIYTECTKIIMESVSAELLKVRSELLSSNEDQGVYDSVSDRLLELRNLSDILSGMMDVYSTKKY